MCARLIKEGMTGEDQIDYEGFLEDLLSCSQLSPEELAEHFKLHWKETFPMLRHFDGHGFAICTSEGTNCLRSIVHRRVLALDNFKDFDLDAVLEEVAQRICPSLKAGAVLEESPEEIFEHVMTSSLETAVSQQERTIYHFPCVLAGAKDPEEFIVGLVRLSTATRFESRLASLDSSGIKFNEEVRGDQFLEHIRQFGWVISVQVPPCSPEISKARAELAARTAINIVRVWFGLGHGRRMRVVHLEPATANFSKYLVEASKGISLMWSRTREGAAIDDGWFAQVEEDHLKIVSWLLRDILFDERSEIAERLIDALSWFGDAAFEPSPGARIAKLVMLLERLTTNARFSKKRFCKRVAILALESGDEADFTEKYWKAYDFYNARSTVVHGSASQASSEHWKSLNDALPVVVNSIFCAMQIYQIVKFPWPGIPRSLQGFFDKEENKWRSITDILDTELKLRDDARGF